MTMKKTLVLFSILLSSAICTGLTAQIRFGLNLNIGSQPIWGPTGYDHVSYYYLPDIDAYYNVSSRQYIYNQRGQWVFSSSLPMRYRDYDLYSGYKVVVNEPRPYFHAQVYRDKYAGFKGNHSQEVIRNSHEQKYLENKNHPEHDKWQGNQGRKGDERDHH